MAQYSSADTVPGGSVASPGSVPWRQVGDEPISTHRGDQNQAARQNGMEAVTVTSVTQFFVGCLKAMTRFLVIFGDFGGQHLNYFGARTLTRG